MLRKPGPGTTETVVFRGVSWDFFGVSFGGVSAFADDSRLSKNKCANPVPAKSADVTNMVVAPI